jgi:hypothetical protein
MDNYDSLSVAIAIQGERETIQLLEATLEAMLNNSHNRVSRLEAWMDGVKDDRESDLQELAAENAKIEMANKLLAIIKERRA